MFEFEYELDNVFDSLNFSEEDLTTILLELEKQDLGTNINDYVKQRLNIIKLKISIDNIIKDHNIKQVVKEKPIRKKKPVKKVEKTKVEPEVVFQGEKVES